MSRPAVLVWCIALAEAAVPHAGQTGLGQRARREILLGHSACTDEGYRCVSESSSLHEGVPLWELGIGGGVRQHSGRPLVWAFCPEGSLVSERRERRLAEMARC